MMKQLVSAALLSVLCSCRAAPIHTSSPIIPVQLIPIEHAKTLMVSGQVKEVFQPHHGCVVLTLHNGDYLSFEQPQLDWVLTFIEEAGLERRIAINVE